MPSAINATNHTLLPACQQKCRLRALALTLCSLEMPAITCFRYCMVSVWIMHLIKIAIRSGQAVHAPVQAKRDQHHQLCLSLRAFGWHDVRTVLQLSRICHCHRPYSQGARIAGFGAWSLSCAELLVILAVMVLSKSAAILQWLPTAASTMLGVPGAAPIADLVAALGQALFA